MSIRIIATKTTTAALAGALLGSAAIAAETVVDLPNGIKGTLSVPDTGATVSVP